MPILRQLVNAVPVYMISSSDGKITAQASASEALDLLNAFESVKQQILADTAQRNTTFKGLIEFNQDNSAKHANVACLVGTTLMYRWSDLNPSEGVIDFSRIEHDLALWQGKKIILRVSASGWKQWKPSNTSWTPSWVYQKGAKSVTVDDGSIKPVYWDTVFLTAYQTFLQAFGQKYDGDARIAALEMGIGDGGETKPDTSKFSDRLKKWQAVGYTDTLWLATIKELIQMYRASFSSTPLILMPDASFLGSTLKEADVLTVAIDQGCWLQENGLIPGETINPVFQKTTLIMEQRAASTDAKTLDQELATALKNNAVYVLIFSSVFDDQKQLPILEKYASLAH